MALHNSLKNTMVPKQVQKLVWRIGLSNLLEIPEDKFAVMIREIESESMFKRLLFSAKKEERIIGYKRFPNTGLSGSFYELNEHITSDNNTLDIESLLYAKKGIDGLIKKLGLHKFEEYFLYNETSISVEELSGKTGLSASEVIRINDFINEISIHNEFYTPPSTSLSAHVRYIKVASIENCAPDEAGNQFTITMTYPHMARGKYLIDYDKLESLKKSKILTKEEVKSLNLLLRKLELINIKKSTLYQIIQNIVVKQTPYFVSGDVRDMLPFTQKELASIMNVNESIVSRSIYGRSLVTPECKEEPIKHFVPNRKEVRKYMIKEIVSDNYTVTDSTIKSTLKEKYNIDISRRSVAECRKELNILPIYKRPKTKEVNT